MSYYWLKNWVGLSNFDFKEDEMSSRFDYVEYTKDSQEKSDARKKLAKELEAMIEEFPNSREKSLAMTKLEECFMWIGKAIKVEQEKG